MSVVWNFKEYQHALVFSGFPWYQVFLTNKFMLPIYSLEWGEVLGLDYQLPFGIGACASLPSDWQKMRLNCLAEGQNTVNMSRAWSQALWCVAQCTDHLRVIEPLTKKTWWRGCVIFGEQKNKAKWRNSFKNAEIFWMNNKAIIEFDFCRIWRILQI